MHNQYKDDVQFYFVYCREAHAIDSDRPAGRTAVEQPLSTEERRKVAQTFLDDMDFDLPALVDDINDKTANEYASLPDRLYLVGKDGKIAFAGDKGPRGFKPDLLEQAIRKATGKAPSTSSESSASSTPPAQPRGGGGAGGGDRMQMMMARMPFMQAVDADKDGSLSSEEIENSVKALMSLDKNGDGKLTMPELAPQRGRGR